MQARCALPLLRYNILHQETVRGIAILQHSRLVRALLSVCLWISPALDVVEKRVALKRLSPGQQRKQMKKILVAVKRVIDYNARIRVKPDKVHH